MRPTAPSWWWRCCWTIWFMFRCMCSSTWCRWFCTCSWRMWPECSHFYVCVFSAVSCVDSCNILTPFVCLFVCFFFFFFELLFHVCLFFRVLCKYWPNFCRWIIHATQNGRWVYPFLNWYPATASIYYFGILIGFIIIYFIVFGLSVLKARVLACRNKPQVASAEKEQGTEMREPWSGRFLKSRESSGEEWWIL